MALSSTLQALVQQAQKTGTLPGLPEQHFIDRQWLASIAGARMQSLDPGTGAAFADFAAGDAER